MPAEAKGTSQKSAKAFVRYYIDAVNFAMRTGDTRSVRDASVGGCESCSAVITNVGGLYADGGHLVGKGWRITAQKAISGQPQAMPIVQTGVRVTAQTRFSSKGAEPQRFDGGQKLMTFFLVRRSDAWQVKKWDQTQ